MIQQNQFSRSSNEDPNEHIVNFIEMCDTFRIHNISDEAIRLRLFSFSLRDRAKSWLQFLPVDSITRDEICQVFFAKFFPFEKTVCLRNEIHCFSQLDGETLHEAWARFKEMLRKCPHHRISLPEQLQTFYYGLITSTKTLVNNAAGGTVLTKTPSEFHALLEEFARSNNQWSLDKKSKHMQPTAASIIDMKAIKAMMTQMAAVQQQLAESRGTWNVVHAASPKGCFWCN